MAIPSAMRTAALTSAAMLAFAANSLLCRAALGTDRIDSITFTTIRLTSGAAALVALTGVRPDFRRAGSSASAAALFLYAIAFSLAYVRIAAGVGALLLFGAVQVTMIGRVLMRGTRLGLREYLGAAAALCGLLVLARPGLAAPDATGTLLMIGAGIGWGAYSLRGVREKNPIAVTAGNFVRAAAPALIMSLVAAPFSDEHWSAAGVFLAVLSGVIASALGYVVWYAALRGLRPSTAAVVQLSAPLLAAIGGVVFLHEALTTRLLIATPLVIGGIALAVLDRTRT